MKVGAIELRNSILGILRLRHFNKCEAARLTRFPIGNDTDALYSPVGCECGVKIFLSSLITEITDKYVGHSV